jgi:hypothetical protein
MTNRITCEGRGLKNPLAFKSNFYFSLGTYPIYIGYFVGGCWACLTC